MKYNKYTKEQIDTIIKKSKIILELKNLQNKIESQSDYITKVIDEKVELGIELDSKTLKNQLFKRINKILIDEFVNEKIDLTNLKNTIDSEFLKYKDEVVDDKTDLDFIIMENQFLNRTNQLMLKDLIAKKASLDMNNSFHEE